MLDVHFYCTKDFLHRCSTDANKFAAISVCKVIAREGDAPAEPWRCQLGRSLALPLFFDSLGIAKPSLFIN